MTNETSTANSSFRDDHHPLADAQGQAALLLIESLIHSLLDNGVLAKHHAIEAIESAMQVKEESAVEGKEPVQTLRKSLGLLNNMQRSIAAYSGRHDTSVEAGAGANHAD